MNEHQSTNKTPPTPKQNNQAPSWAFIAAAGMGNRMRPLTDHLPKPLIVVRGQSLLDHIVDRLLAAGITDIVLNTHYHSAQIEEWAQNRAACTPPLKITLFHEPELLDTGGGIENVLTQDQRTTPFYMINGDAFWVDDAVEPSLKSLSQHWQNSSDILCLLLEPTAQMKLTTAVGDYNIKAPDRAERCADQTGDYMFTGLRIVHPDILHYKPASDTAPKYSFLALMDAAEKNGRLGAHIHKGRWHHLSTPADVASVNQATMNTSENSIKNAAKRG